MRLIFILGIVINIIYMIQLRKQIEEEKLLRNKINRAILNNRPNITRAYLSVIRDIKK